MNALSFCFLSKLVSRPFSMQSLPPQPSLATRRNETKPQIPPSTALSSSIGATVTTSIFDTFEDIIHNYIDPPLRPALDPRLVLSGNFAPVNELPPTECEVIQGALPSCLDGAYIRNGPNPQYFPRGSYHLFDGDGMLHSLRISQGRATLCSRYVKTYKYTTERKLGSSIVPNLFSSFSSLPVCIARCALCAARIIMGHYDPAKGIGHANTSLALFSNRLYALCEYDLPYNVRLTSDGDIETLGRHDFDGTLLAANMTAHPKVDPDSGEAFAFRYGPIRPFLTYFYFDANGNKHPDVHMMSLPHPSFVHDFAITKNYALFADIEMRMKTPIEMIVQGGPPMVTDPAKVARVGVIPRHAENESEMRWFNVPGFNPMHFVNAWEEDNGNAIVLIAPNFISIQHALERLDHVNSMMEKVRIDLKTGLVTRQPVSLRNLEFAVINPSYLTKKNRYVYSGICEPLAKMSGVVKLDLSKGEFEECTVASRMYGPGCYGGEPFFVAKEGGESEDDGYLVSYVHNENTGESRFLVMDAKSPHLHIVATVKLPQRVPYGFHGLFVRQSELNNL
ncbi:carotenoid cleavage dioxygenase 4, nine-cis-epoxycarotenoid dioxygenase 4 [Hibiscus trionum]|uniref:Carotenoid cleavage dioxygenase 4, nine-cis-epoxycarotenoid dioxygenase 4 n=1 Tax=Hibiscus trionum TaxID=183268 RepID=A0A9W7MDV1_HIBTR|nr:carotenoid cleavage dioxygenase 4, nine-cis-epoxycarotenoid dioxygenase 4 [Hibiscus trionum]